MKYSIQITTQFKKDYKQAVKRGCDIPKLKKVISILFPSFVRPHHILFF